MALLLLANLSLTLCSTAWAQGTLVFSNIAAPVYDEDGVTKLEGSTVVARLYASQTAEANQAVGTGPVSFRTGTGAGIISETPTITISFGTPGSYVYVKMVAYEAVYGSYEAALASGGKCGESPVILVKTGGDGIPPSLPTSLAYLRQSFSLGRRSTELQTSLTSPTEGSVFLTPVDVPLEATASGPTTIASVRFYTGTLLLGTVTAKPYQITWTNAPVGAHWLTTVAHDSYGQSVTSAPVSIVVSDLPTVALSQPTQGATFAIGTTIALEATATNTPGDIQTVQFYDGWELLGQDASSPYQFSWAGASPGSHALTAVATDTFGLSSTSAPVAITFLGPPVFQLSQANYDVSEGAGSVVLTVLKSSNSQGGSVNFVTLEGTATAVQDGLGDFIPRVGTLEFAPEDSEKTIVITLHNDSSYEGNQQFTVALRTSGDGSTLGTPNTATITLLEDDVQPTTNSVAQVVFPTDPPPHDGRLLVRLEPTEASGRQWRFAWDSAWRNSGEEVRGLPSGAYELEFRPLPSYVQPPNAYAEVTSGLLTVSTNYYVATATRPTGSLRVHLEPAGIGAQWKLLGESDDAWRNSETTAGNVAEGAHTVEFKTVTGFLTPFAQRATVLRDQLTVLAASYAPTGDSGAAIKPIALASLNAITEGLATGKPYAFVGQLQSDAGLGSGCVVRKHVVLTAAHVIFNDVNWTYVAGVQWFFQRHRGEYEPTPQTPRGWYVFSGYATQRQADGTPGVSSPASQNLDVAVLYFTDPPGAGGSSGYLASEPTGTEWLLSDANKMVIGYPVDPRWILETNRGRMHATLGADLPFQQEADRVFTSTGLESYAGNSGGPLCVRNAADSNYYPAAIYLAGGTRTVVRAIDGAVAALINQAEIMADTGDTNYVGGGVPMAPSTGGASPFAPGYLRVVLEPPEALAAGAGWRILGSGNTNYVADNLAALPLLPATYTVEFRPAAGFAPSTHRSVQVPPAGQTTVITNHYQLTRPTIGSLVATGGTFRLRIQSIPGQRYVLEASSNLAGWYPVATNSSVTSGTWDFADPAAGTRSRLFYRGRSDP